MFIDIQGDISCKENDVSFYNSTEFFYISLNFNIKILGKIIF